jgi:hypothetical protein
MYLAVSSNGHADRKTAPRIEVVQLGAESAS